MGMAWGKELMPHGGGRILMRCVARAQLGRGAIVH